MGFSQLKFEALLATYGYKHLEIPTIEPVNLFLTKAGDKIIDRLLKFNRHGRTFALRPEFTASAAKYYVENNLSGARRWQFQGRIFADVPGTAGDLFEEQSAGAELMGISDEVADAEIIHLAIRGAVEQGLQDWQLVIGHVGLTRQVLDAFNLDDQITRFLLNNRYLLRSDTGRDNLITQLDDYLMTNQTNQPLLDEKAVDHVTEQTFTMMAQTSGRDHFSPNGRTATDVARRLARKQQQMASRDRILAAIEQLSLWTRISAKPTSAIEQIKHTLHNTESMVLASFKRLINLLDAYDIPPDAVTLQPDLARTWDYYTGMVFELHASDGSVIAAGGRYDELAQLLGANSGVPAVGFAYNVERLAQYLPTDAHDTLPVWTIYSDQPGEGAIWWSQQLHRRGFSVAIDTDDTLFDISVNETDSTALFKNRVFGHDQVDELAQLLTAQEEIDE